MRRAVLLLILALPASAPAQISFSGAHSAALAGATTGLSGDRRGDANPAAWGRVRRWSLLVHGAQLYDLEELRHAGALLLAPLRIGTAALGASTFGYDLYRESTIEIGLGGGAAVGTFRQIFVGARSRWHVVHIRNYGQASAVSFTAGLHLPVTPFITLGVVTHGVIVRGTLRSEVPRRLAMGASYRPTASFAVTADLCKEVRSPASVATGVELSPVPPVVVRAGVASSPSLVAGGVGIRLPHIEIDVAAVRHDVLGWSPSLSALFRW